MPATAACTEVKPRPLSTATAQRYKQLQSTAQSSDPAALVSLLQVRLLQMLLLTLHRQRRTCFSCSSVLMTSHPLLEVGRKT